MPELPELQAHAERLGEDFDGAELAGFRPITFTALKTYRPEPSEAVGSTVTAFGRRGKYLLMEVGPVTFVVHLMQGGRLRPDEKQSAKPRGGIARWTFADGRALLLTEPGNERKAGVWVVSGDLEGQPPLEGLGPDADGLDVCRRIKTDPETRDIPVVFLSATATTQDDRIRGLEHGGDAYLTAPIAPELLAATIRAFLRTRRAEAQARSAAREWQATFDAVQHGICLLDREGRIVRANRAFADILGKEPAELVGMSRQQAFPEAEAPPGGWPFERTRVSKRRESAEVRVGDRWFEVIADPLLDSNGEFTGAVRTTRGRGRGAT